MSSADEQGPNDEVLRRYLLGSVSAEETERLDELSVVDDEFALRLDAVENDLVDAYARGDLSGEALERFQKFYLSSPRRQEKVEFARTLHRFGEKSAKAVVHTTTQAITPDVKPTGQTFQSRSPRRWFTVPRLRLQWGFAFAAIALLFAGSYLFVENQRLRQQATEARNQNQRTQDLESQLKEQRTANSGLQKELESLRESAARAATLSVLLVPETRGINPTKSVHIRRGTDHLALRLQLESDDFPAYRVTLKDSTTDRSIWNSSELKAQTEGSNKAVSINIPAGKLKGQNYVLELFGIPVRGAPESLSSYTFRAVPD